MTTYSGFVLPYPVYSVMALRVASQVTLGSGIESKQLLEFLMLQMFIDFDLAVSRHLFG